ncbi:hypothetical protein [Pseudomonas mosselii]|uniref:hypothetical protein n=1 Tax=Pseudomonas mosselii TaxID=78327 RepID=UPI0021D9646A|nr:hypothetical protein [Pseudomonas mosselii]MCU9527473.1 hypothetical protein [Pseudomonas mosselii]MCU9534786.1 hypothetical protein [Pseudomonas mosselii]MCU9542720.1 hypothetical protein [Pseudomonas mosselii]MCU9546626.1 hypothetical protein [Pseudomonas mosselii]
MRVLNRLLPVAAFALLAGCQNAQQAQYRAACPDAEIPQACKYDLSRAGCERVSIQVDSCARFVDRAVTEQEYKQARAHGFVTPHYQNQRPPIILLGIKEIHGSGTAFYIDSTSLESYERSLREARDLLAWRVAQYEAAVKTYQGRAASGSATSTEAMETAVDQILKLKGPLEQAARAGEPIVSFYKAQPSFDYSMAAVRLSTSLGARNEVLQNGSRLAVRSHKEREPYPGVVRAVVTTAGYKSMASDLDKTWPQRLAQDKAEGDRKAAAFTRQRAQKVAAEAKQRRYHDLYQAPAERGGSQGYSNGGCSCSGGNVCYGPRGGRYCITSGGNKRYL